MQIIRETHPTKASKQTTIAQAATNSKSNKREEEKENKEGTSKEKVKMERMESSKGQRKA